MQANNRTDIICKHFLEAVEKRQYGWFWVCPNGGKDCKYRHALPPGYVLKSQMKVRDGVGQLEPCGWHQMQAIALDPATA